MLTVLLNLIFIGLSLSKHTFEEDIEKYKKFVPKEVMDHFTDFIEKIRKDERENAVRECVAHHAVKGVHLPPPAAAGHRLVGAAPHPVLAPKYWENWKKSHPAGGVVPPVGSAKEAWFKHTSMPAVGGVVPPIVREVSMVPPPPDWLQQKVQADWLKEKTFVGGVPSPTKEEVKKEEVKKEEQHPNNNVCWGEHCGGLLGLKHKEENNNNKEGEVKKEENFRLPASRLVL
jgi:hypothetical protein